jgi:hypothetical protein
LTLKGVRITNGTYSGVYGFHITITDSIIDGNQSPTGAGGVTAVCDLTIADSTVSNNTRGGGILTNALTMTNTTVSGNSGDPGGISAATATITNSTISGNTAPYAGSTAGIAVTSATLKFVTITANSILGGNASVGVGLYTSGATTLSHTVITGNTGAPGSSDVEISGATPGWPIGDHNWAGSIGPNAQIGLNNSAFISSCPAVNLGALANNGGGKQTHALLSGSCLLDAGDVCSATALPYDERGSGHNRCVNGSLDIGAFESGSAAVNYAITANANPVAGGTAGCTPNPVSSGGSSTCTATANAGYLFTGWSGACSGANCALNNVTAAASVTANFSVVSSPAPAGVTAVPLLSPRSLALLSLLTLLATLLATTVSRRQ